ncbi:putative bifunctional diguanylate cyclase/phosphodiesterase [Aureimonas pseudogalii]|uniref:Diguanylate cyclase (GGDEF)-like protein n=1 Tax=Aureimonas pseudogalii TaxID=1744844 RepID=A0A7W6EBY8_9HYPH|nr:EAL domain-containing protein [Aureimonas pseudogalii]MBB3996432.1 diguanylate cyclase (GGDEF)-like protein [Aureimonas pseudogalii]
MSIKLKLLCSAVLLAIVATTFAVMVHVRNEDVRSAVEAVFQNGVDPLDRLTVASAKATDLENRFLAKSTPAGVVGPIGASDGAELLAGLSEILGELRQSALEVPEGPSSRRLSELAYALNRLRVAEGDVTHRLVRRELSTIVDEFDTAANALRADIMALRQRSVDHGQSVDQLVWTGLGIGSLVGLLVFMALGRSIGRSIRNAAAALTRVGDPSADPPVRPNVDPMDDLANAIRFVEASISDRDNVAARLRKETHRRLESELHSQRQRFENALDNMTQAFCLVGDDLTVLAANDAFVRMFPGIAAGSRAETVRRHADLAAILASDDPEMQVHQLRSGRHLQVRRHDSGGERGTILIFDDITEQVAARGELERLSRQDPLTGLSNRSMFYEHLNGMMAQDLVDDEIAVIAIDIADFNSVNTTLGHMAGDDLLRQVGERLAALVRPGDLVARLDGDEFGIVQRLKGQPDAGHHLCRMIAEDLQKRPVTVAGRPLGVRVAIGMVPLAKADRAAGRDAHAVMQDCELALYQAKADTGSKLRLYAPGIREEMEESQRLVSDLRDALDRDEFELYFQPIVNLPQRAISGFEALVRWNSPTRGQVSPGLFIPVMEANGLIVRLGRFVMRDACRQAARWPSNLSLSINLSPAQFKSADLVGDIRKSIETSGIDPRRLQLEVTESLFLDEADAILETLVQLRRLGLLVSMDDFGTGYSSLGYLSRFPFDRIKIDQSFVRDMSRSENIAIVRAVQGLGAAMGMTVVAEGVETAEQLAMLEAEGCTDMQGFLFSRPRPASDLAKMLVEVRNGFASGAYAVSSPQVAVAAGEPA